MVFEEAAAPKVAWKVDSATTSALTEATARTNSPFEPLLSVKGPSTPSLPLAIVTTTPCSTRREAATAQGSSEKPDWPPTEQVMISA